MFFKKFCIATRTKVLKLKGFSLEFFFFYIRFLGVVENWIF